MMLRDWSLAAMELTKNVLKIGNENKGVLFLPLVPVPKKYRQGDATFQCGCEVSTWLFSKSSQSYIGDM